MDTKLSQITDATPRSKGGDVCEEAPTEECAAKNLQTTGRHLGFTEKIYGFPRTLLCCQYKRRTPTVVREFLPRTSTKRAQTFPAVARHRRRNHGGRGGQGPPRFHKGGTRPLSSPPLPSPPSPPSPLSPPLPSPPLPSPPLPSPPLPSPPSALLYASIVFVGVGLIYAALKFLDWKFKFVIQIQAKFVSEKKFERVS